MACDCNSNRNSLESQVKTLKDLREVSKAVVSTLDLDTVLHAILRSAMDFAAAPAGSVTLYNESRHELSLQVHAGLSADFLKKERWEAVPGGLTDQMLRAGEIHFVEDTGQSAFFDNTSALNEGIRSLVFVPLVFQSRIMGVLYLADFLPRTFDRDKMDMLSILACFAAMSIHTAALDRRTAPMATTDLPTGLHNHRYFKQYFKQEMGRARRYNKPFSIIMMDIDDFKSYNDTFGRATGDQLLATMGALILQVIRGVDVAFRYGGEEFIVLLPETRLEKAILAAERLRESVQLATANELAGAATRGVTVSIGVASFPENADKTDELFNIVDSLLYQAKRCGKNRVYHQKSLLVPAL